MKRVLICVLALVMGLLTVGCNRRLGYMNDTTYALGVQALAVVDDFLNGMISAQEAILSIEDLQEKLSNTIPLYDNEETSHLIVSADLALTHVSLRRILSDPETSLERLTRNRNNLANILGKRSRR